MNESILRNQLKNVLIMAGVLLACIVILAVRHMILLRRMRVGQLDPETGALTEGDFLKKAEKITAGSRHFAVVSAQIAGLLRLSGIFGPECYHRTLHALSAELSSCLGQEALIARSGEDSFCFALRCRSREELAVKLDTFAAAVGNLETGAGGGMLHALFGVYFSDAGGERAGEVLDKAVLARLEATQEQPCRYYESDLLSAVARDRDMAAALENAEEKGEFFVFYQHKVNLADGTVSGLEALIRWRHPQRGLLSPEMFLPIAEAHRSAERIDRFVFEEVCATLARWQEEKKALCPVSVNLSACSINCGDLAEVFYEIYHSYDLPDGLIELEFGEALLMEHRAAAKAAIEKLHVRGFRCGMDHFGSELCAVQLLGTLDLDTIKLDHSFFSGENNSRQGRYLLENILRLAAQLHIHTVAVGVDSPGQVNYLRQAACDAVQGFYYFKPMPREILEKELFGADGALRAVASETKPGDALLTGSDHRAQSFRNIFLFSYWPQDDEVEFSEPFSPIFHNQTHFKNASALFRTTELIHENDRKDFFRLLEHSARTQGWVENTLRFYISERQYAWLEMRMHREVHNDTVFVSGMLVNVEGWKNEINRWKEKAERDALTGLYNREHFEQAVQSMLDRNTGTAAVLFIDVDDFKQVNDSHGHIFGDSLLCYVAKQLLAVFRHTDVIARYGGDEFVVFAPDIERSVIDKRLEKLFGIFLHPFRNDTARYTVSLSIGVAMYPQDGENRESLLEHADNALYEAKNLGKNRYAIYEPYMTGKTREAEVQTVGSDVERE